jgi:hypothetical protein
VVVGGNHRNVAFQFGTSITVEMIDGQIIEFKISVCEVICRKDTAKLIECTILPRLTNVLEVVKLIPLCISVNTDDGKLVCEYNSTPSLGWEFYFLGPISGTPIGSGILILFTIPKIPVVFFWNFDFWRVRKSEFRFANFGIPAISCTGTP